MRQVRSLSFHRDLETRNSTEVASVWRKASSPYSFHRNVTVATLSIMTITAVTMRNTCNEEMSQPADVMRSNTRIMRLARILMKKRRSSSSLNARLFSEGIVWLVRGEKMV